MPEAEGAEVEVHDRDVRVDVYRSSGAGGQHVNTTEVISFVSSSTPLFLHNQAKI